MEVVLSFENLPAEDSNYCQEELKNEIFSSIHNMEGYPVKAEETKQNDVAALWVKWRGKWQAGIQCSNDDCPSATLKAKPTYGRKNYIVVYFPNTCSHCWADSQLVCPITEKPEPLAYGTHESGVELVKDLCTPRRYIMQKLAVAMLDVSDQLHVEAVVESVRSVNAWKEFAKEAGQCKNYSDLGRMLLKLHSMILEVYISPTWMKNSFDLWKQQCENAQTAESTEILTKELVDSVLWDDVAKLWDAPVQPELGSDWKTWKEEVMKWFSTSNPPSASGLEAQYDMRSSEEPTDISNLEISRKRPKLEIRRGEMRALEATDVCESETKVDRELLYSPFLDQQAVGTLGLSNLPTQGYSYSSIEGLSNSCSERMDNTSNKTTDNCEYQIIPYTGGFQETPITEHLLSGKSQLMGGEQGSQSEHRYRQCSAFMETKGRQCSRWANDGDIYCCMHLNFHFADNARMMDQAGSLSSSSICQGMTIYGRRCTHRSKNGSSFCKKHLLRDGQILDEGDRTPSSSILVNSNKRARLSVEVRPLDKNATSVDLCLKEMSQNESNLNLISDTAFQDLGEITGSSAQTGGKESVDRHPRLELQSQDLTAQEKPAVKGPYKSASWFRCIGWCRNNSGQCSHRAKPGSSYCEKHLPGSVGHAGKVSDRHVSSELLNELLRSASSEEDRIHLCRATDLLHEFMKGCLLEGITYRSNSKSRVMDWILAEVSRDVKAAEALLKMVSGERERLGKHLGFEEEGAKSGTEIVPWVPEMQIQFSLTAAEDDGKDKPSTEDGMPDTGTVDKYASDDAQKLRCKLCGEEFSDSQALGQHWILIHKKEAQCFLRGYACRTCKSPFTNKKGLERHVKIQHAGSLLEQCILFLCISCGSHFMNYEQLWHHVVSAHSEEFIRSMGIREQVKGTKSAIPMEAEEGQQNEAAICGNSKQELNCKSGLLHYLEKNQNNLSVHNGNTGKDKSFVNRNTVRRYTCRFCGLKFHLLPDLGRHHQAAHMGPNSNKISLPNRGKDIFTAKWRANKVNSKLMQKVGPSVGLKHAAVIARKKSSENYDLQSPVKAKVCSERTEQSGRNDKTTEFYCSAVAEMLLSEIQKTRPWPSNHEILGIARSTCCRFNLHTVLEEKYGPLPERLYLKAARLCSEANIRVEWHREGFICPRQCKQTDNSKPSVLLAPLPDVCIDPLPAQLDNLKTDTREFDNGATWEKAESHLVLTSSDFERRHRGKTIVICEDLSFGRETMPVPCVIDEDVLDPHSYAFFKENKDLHSDSYMPWQSFSYITERLLDPSLGLDTKSSQLGCTCTQPQCFPESCDHVYLFDNDNDDAEDIYGQPMHGRFPYDEKGRIILEEGFLVYECNSLCSCHKECPNRVLQKGVQVKLEVYKTKHKGWAVRAAQMIPRGTFICEYIGEVLNDQEANKRGERYDNEGCSYLYDIDAHIDTSDLVDGVQPYVIDATKYGNVARFINHSCSPNLVNYQVLVESMDCQLAHIGLYASRDIADGEELAYDYRYKLLPGKGCPCHCGAKNCRGRLY